MHEVRTTDWYADDPIHAPGEDVLDRGKFMKGLEDLLDRVHGSGSSSVLALIGSWGSGKSSVLSQIASALGERSGEEVRWIAVPFNPWYYHDLASLQAGFFRELHASLPSGKSWLTVRDSIAGLGRTVAPLGGLLSLLGTDASGAIDGIADMIESDQGVESKRKAAEHALRKAGVPVLVVVDDVDRLDPPELLLLFKLIRLVGRLPNIHYLLAYDEQTLLDALSRTGLVGGDDPRRSIDYLEKIVQVRLDMPPVREDQLSGWVDSSLEQLAQDHQFAINDEVSRRFSAAYFAHIRERLATPRGVKRYFAQVDAFLAGVIEEVDLVDFLVVSWIRAAEPLVYRALIANRGRLLGEFPTRSSDWATGETDAAADRRYWENMFSAARVAPGNVEGVASIVGQLFPRFEHQWSARSYSYSAQKSTPTRIANRDYFDRYFAFTVPEEDIPDQIAHAAYTQIISADRGTELDMLEEQLPNRADLVLSKLDSLSIPGSPESVRVLKWLTHNFYRVPKHNSIADAQQRARWFGGRLYCALNPGQRVNVFDEARQTLPGLLFFSYLSREAAKAAAENLDAPEMDAADIAFSRSISERLNASMTSSPLKIDDEVWSLFWDWKRIDLEAAKRWVAKGLNEHGWPPLDLAARFVSVYTSLGVKNPSRRAGEFALDSLRQVLDLDGLETQLGISPDDADLGLDHDLTATDDNRRLVARKGIAQLFASRPSRDPSDSITYKSGV